VNHKLTRVLGAIVVSGSLAWTAAAPPAADASNNCNVSDASVDGEEQACLGLINSYRARNGASSLSIDGALTRAATWMASDLSSRSSFGHTDSTGRGPWARMPDCGVAAPGGENIAAGTDYSSAQTALNAWINSPSHRDVMLEGKFTTIGIARVNKPGSTYGWYWVTDFGYGGGTSTVATNPAPAAAAPAPAAKPALAPSAPSSVSRAPVPAPGPVAEAPARPTAFSLSAGATALDWVGDYVAPETAFGSQATWVGMVYVFDQGTQTWLRWGPGLDASMQSLTQMRPGVQYWVVATKAVEVAY
jgi:uncharacterized protein YkwD